MSAETLFLIAFFAFVVVIILIIWLALMLEADDGRSGRKSA